MRRYGRVTGLPKMRASTDVSALGTASASAAKRSPQWAVGARDGLAEEALVDRRFSGGDGERVGKPGDREIARVAIGEEHGARAGLRDLDIGDRQTENGARVEVELG